LLRPLTNQTIVRVKFRKRLRPEQPLRENDRMTQGAGETDLYQYWLMKHDGGRPPSRWQIDPIVEIPRLAKHLLLIDVLPDGYRYRVVGSELVRRHGVDLTGRRADLSEGNPNSMREYFAALDTVVRERKPKFLVSRLPTGVAGKFVVLATPLVGPDGRTEHILTGSFYDGYFDPATRPEGMAIQELAMADL
jgi:hypothetical protein